MNDSPLKILFADDDATYSLFLKRFLERAGYEVVHVPDGKQALEQFRLCRPDLVLLDINMPEINGWHGKSAAGTRKCCCSSCPTAPKSPTA